VEKDTEAAVQSGMECKQWVKDDYMTKTFSASEKSKTSLVRGQTTLPSLASAIAVNA